MHNQDLISLNVLIRKTDGSVFGSFPVDAIEGIYCGLHSGIGILFTDSYKSQNPDMTFGTLSSADKIEIPEDPAGLNPLEKKRTERTYNVHANDIEKEISKIRERQHQLREQQALEKSGLVKKSAKGAWTPLVEKQPVQDIIARKARTVRALRR